MPLYLPDDETFASFWPGDNPSLLAALQNVLRQEHSGYIYIWSREGAGRSHLLHAACAELSQRGDAVGYVPLDKRTWFVPEVLEGMEQLALVCIDNIECVAGDEPWEMAIFNLYNRILESGKTRLLITGDRPPRQLNLGLPDLASRLDWGQIYKLQPLSDEDKLQALQLRAGRCVPLPAEAAGSRDAFAVYDPRSAGSCLDYRSAQADDPLRERDP